MTTSPGRHPVETASSTVLDRHRLQAGACGCYEVIRQAIGEAMGRR